MRVSSPNTTTTVLDHPRGPVGVDLAAGWSEWLNTDGTGCPLVHRAALADAVRHGWDVAQRRRGSLFYQGARFLAEPAAPGWTDGRIAPAYLTNSPKIVSSRRAWWAEEAEREFHPAEHPGGLRLEMPH